MLVVRSFIFNIAFYINLLVWMIAALPSLVMPRAVFMRIAYHWTRSTLWLLKVICGTKMEVRGRDKLPPGGFLVGAKHQSIWETFAFFMIFEDPAFIIKRELGWIPLYGWFTQKARSVPVDRKGGTRALTEMNLRAAAEAASGRQIVIFPEGTRRAPGAAPAYKFGIAYMYEQMGLPCVPVALNSGLFWPRRQFLRYPGTIVVEIVEPIAAGLPKDVFFSLLEERIETASDRLLAEGQRRNT